jgi:hypothetical protein
VKLGPSKAFRRPIISSGLVADTLQMGSPALFVTPRIPAKIHPPQRDLARFERFCLPLAVVVGPRLATVATVGREFARDFNGDFPCWRRREALEHRSQPPSAEGIRTVPMVSYRVPSATGRFAAVTCVPCDYASVSPEVGKRKRISF